MPVHVGEEAGATAAIESGRPAHKVPAPEAEGHALLPGVCDTGASLEARHPVVASLLHVDTISFSKPSSRYSPPEFPDPVHHPGPARTGPLGAGDAGALGVQREHGVLRGSQRI